MPRAPNDPSRLIRVGLFAGALALLLTGDLVANPRRHLGDALILLTLTVTSISLVRRSRSAEDRLAHARSQLAVVTSTTDALTWESDAEGNLMTVGTEVQQFFGYSVEEGLQLNLQDVVHPLEFERLAGYVSAGLPWTRERWRCVLQDGTERWFTGSAAPRRNPEGKVTGYVGTTRPLGVDELEQERLSRVAADVYALLSSSHVEPVFQPILSVPTGLVVGVEALSRFPGSGKRPDEWFAAAAQVGLGIELQLLSLRRQLTATCRLPEELYVSVNVDAAALRDPRLRDALLQSPVAPDRFVLEITEHDTIADYEGLLHELTPLRALGIRVAVDDAGAGYASFRHILRLTPEIIKLDRSLVEGIHQDPARRALATAVVAFARGVGAQTCGEGVELHEELMTLRDIGIDTAQGFFFGHPAADLPTWDRWS